MRPELLHIFWLLINSLITFSYVEALCEFPESWAGGWFQSGEPQLISINATHIATKGRCLESNGDKFLIHDRSDNCYRCVVIHQKHDNVLQYKETYCDRVDELEELCEQITGDATLFSMFRAEAPPSACPFVQPPFTFTYNRGSGECKSPVSRVDSCTDDSRLLLRYQACPDVHGTESTVEELVCLAWWKEGSIRYLVGKVEHSMAHSDEDRYRCFVYEKRRSEGVIVYQLAQSGDATCNGLLSATEGSRTITLTKVTREMSACRYPTWLGEHHTWHTLDHTSTLHASHSNATLRLQSQHHPQPIRLVCHRLITSEHYIKLVAHLTTGCDSGYVCLALYRRDSHVLEMQQSQKRTHSADDACLPENFNPSFLPYTTFITGAMKPRPCPHLGLYMLSQTGGDLGGGVGGGEFALASSLGESPGSGEGIDGVPESPQAPPPECGARRFESLAVGCSASDQMEFRSSCVQDSVTAYACHGSWSEDGSSFLIAAPLARKSGGARRYCFAYTPAPGTDSSSPGGGGGGIGGGGVGAPGGGTVLSVTQSCRRRRTGDGGLDAFNTAHQHASTAPLIADHHATWTFNLTAHGQCGSSSQAPVRSPKALWVILLAFLLSLVHVAQSRLR